MATINFEVHGARGVKGGAPQTITSVDTTPIPSWNKDRVIYVTAALSHTLGVPAGQYEHVSQDASGNWTYAPANRNV